MQASSHLLGQQEAAGTSVSTTTSIRKLVLVALGISLLFQTVAISAPGWQIHSHVNYSIQTGLFYFVECEERWKLESCRTKSFSDLYLEAIKNTDTRTMKIYMQSIFVRDVVYLGFEVMLAWFCTLTSAIVLQMKYRKLRATPLLWTILATTLAVAGIIMGDIIFEYLVHTDAEVRIDKVKDRSSVGFPYSLVFYILACSVVLLSVAALFKGFHDDINALSNARPGTEANENEINLRLLSDTRL